MNGSPAVRSRDTAGVFRTGRVSARIRDPIVGPAPPRKTPAVCTSRPHLLRGVLSCSAIERPRPPLLRQQSQSLCALHHVVSLLIVEGDSPFGRNTRPSIQPLAAVHIFW